MDSSIGLLGDTASSTYTLAIILGLVVGFILGFGVALALRRR